MINAMNKCDFHIARARKALKIAELMRMDRQATAKHLIRLKKKSIAQKAAARMAVKWFGDNANNEAGYDAEGVDQYYEDQGVDPDLLVESEPLVDNMYSTLDDAEVLVRQGVDDGILAEGVDDYIAQIRDMLDKIEEAAETKTFTYKGKKYIAQKNTLGNLFSFVANGIGTVINALFLNNAVRNYESELRALLISIMEIHGGVHNFVDLAQEAFGDPSFRDRETFRMGIQLMSTMKLQLKELKKSLTGASSRFFGEYKNSVLDTVEELEASVELYEGMFKKWEMPKKNSFERDVVKPINDLIVKLTRFADGIKRVFESPIWKQLGMYNKYFSKILI